MSNLVSPGLTGVKQMFNCFSSVRLASKMSSCVVRDTHDDEV